MTRRDFLRALQGTAVLAFMPATVAKMLNNGIALTSAQHPNNPLSTPAELSERMLEQMMVDIRLECDARGIPMYINPTRLHVSPAGALRLEQIAREEMYDG